MSSVSPKGSYHCLPHIRRTIYSTPNHSLPYTSCFSCKKSSLDSGMKLEHVEVQGTQTFVITSYNVFNCSRRWDFLFLLYNVHVNVFCYFYSCVLVSRNRNILQVYFWVLYLLFVLFAFFHCPLLLRNHH